MHNDIHQEASATRPSDQTNSNVQTSVRDQLQPSLKDFQDFNNRNKTTLDKNGDGNFDACGPDYTITPGRNGENQMNPTAKRMEYDRQAREALNAPEDKSAGDASPAERESAAKVAEWAKKAQEDLKTSTQDNKRDKDMEALRQIFQNMDPAAAQRVINEANKLLQRDNLRFAQTPSGEIWMGSKDNAGTPYYLNARVKEAPCMPVA